MVRPETNVNSQVRPLRLRFHSSLERPVCPVNEIKTLPRLVEVLQSGLGSLVVLLGGGAFEVDFAEKTSSDVFCGWWIPVHRCEKRRQSKQGVQQEQRLRDPKGFWLKGRRWQCRAEKDFRQSRNRCMPCGL